MKKIKGFGFLSADPESAKQKGVAVPVLIDSVENEVLVADVEGMDIYRVNEKTAYLIVSSQGDFTYAVYDIANGHAYLGSFSVVNNIRAGIDGAQETDGLTITNQNLGENFPAGMLVIQDGYNRFPAEPQNFKYVSWLDVAKTLKLQLH